MRFFAIVSLALLAACSGGPEKKESLPPTPNPQPRNTVQVPAATTSSITLALTAYYQLKDALVEYDTAAANKAAQALAIAADSIKTEGISDTALSQTLRNFAGTVASEAKDLGGETDLLEKKRSFRMISENLYPMLQAVQYNAGTVYHQMCPMAFNDNETAYWLSNNREVVNPYLGKKHPKYASGMLHCGELTDSLAYTK
jgi:hypothetical protein